MAKKKQRNVVQMLSPENYIRQKARTLPVHECWINKSWHYGHLAHIVVARKHITGNLTIGIYLADLGCLGIKNAHYMFNVFRHDYDEMMADMKSRVDLEKVPYELVHNVLYGAMEYAEEIGFEPHKDFSVAQYILEEVEADIDYVEIDCGENGIPLYYRGPEDSDAFVKKVLSTLNKTVGQGNYRYVDGPEDDDDEHPKEHLDKLAAIYEDMIERFKDHSFKEKVYLVKDMAVRDDALEADERMQYYFLQDSIIQEMLDSELVEELYEKMSSQLEEIKFSEQLTNKFLGIEPDSKMMRTLEKAFHTFDDLANSKSGNAGKYLTELHKEIPDNPMVHYLELSYLQKINSDGFLATLDSYYQKFPDYLLIKIQWHINHYSYVGDRQPCSLDELTPAVFFANNNAIHQLELHRYLEMLALISSEGQNLNEMEVAERLYNDYIGTVEDDYIIRLINNIRLQIIMMIDECTPYLD